MTKSRNYQHFQKAEWLGHFSYPDNSFSFPGRLKYSPEGGVQLEYLCEMGAKIGRASYLVGALDSGKACILVGEFDPRKGGLSLGSIAIYRGTQGFRYCVFGTKEPPETTYRGIKADFSHFQEFCFPQGFKSTAPWSKDATKLFVIDSIEISLIQGANFELAGPQFSNVFHSDNTQLVLEVEAFMKGLRDKYPNDYLFARKDIHWYLQIQHATKATVHDLVKDVFSVANLLSLLHFYPVRPVEVFVIGDGEDGRPVELEILMGIGGLNSEALDFFKREPSHFNMPITLKKINAGRVFENWWKYASGYESFVPKIVHDFGTRTEYELRSEIVLLLAQLEKINDEIGGDKSGKFEFPIEHYGRSELLALIREALLVADACKVGPALSDLRNEIAHFGRPVKLLNRMSVNHLMVGCRCLDLIAASHIYKQLEISDEIIGEFQRHHLVGLRDLLSH